MLYKKRTPELDMELFQNPTMEYRGTPFWGWNCSLESEELKRQLEIFKAMGFGGAHIHVRTGMTVTYLGDRFMDLVKECVNKAKETEMLIWLYDEDRWPSGAAGGLVTKTVKYRAQHLLFTPHPYGSVNNTTSRKRVKSTVKAVRTENGRLLACYDIHLDSQGRLIEWNLLHEQENARYEKWYAYVERNRESPWYNNQDYINVLNKEAVDRFIDITHNKYFETVGQEFDKTIPAIFTDEPQIPKKETLRYALGKEDVMLPWIDDLADTFKASCNEDLLQYLPELIWERADGQFSAIRYHYHDHICERFIQSYMDNIGTWCQKHNISFTGHMLGEESLSAQTYVLGDVMRCSRSLELPGIDMLCSHFEYITAKQVQSVVHQYNREGMLSELYGVTNWDLDFRGHKLHGDWQAALGVTVRVPNLAMVSLKGEAKRDYPGSINYQASWWSKYSLVEDHFARLNTVLTRGKPVVKVGILHPIESFWLHWGPENQTAELREDLETDFKNLTEWLLFGSIDFDFINEALLLETGHEENGRMKVGCMDYDMILIPGCDTLRSNTYAFLEQFHKTGGKLALIGKAPTLENARVSKRGNHLSSICKSIPYSRSAIMEALTAVRILDIREVSGRRTQNILHQLRQDGETQWLFLAHGKEPYNKDIAQYQDIEIAIKGIWDVLLYDTLTGVTGEIAYYHQKQSTIVSTRMYSYDSLLLKLTPSMIYRNPVSEQKSASRKNSNDRRLFLPQRVPFTLEEPNVLLLDQAEYALDDEDWNGREEILRIDELCRKRLGWSSQANHVVQPWALTIQPPTHTIHLRWTIPSETECKNVKLAMEDLNCLGIRWNGEAVSNIPTGWYADRSIQTTNLSKLRKGINILEVSIPFGENTNLEWAYLLGDFGVEVSASYSCIVPLRPELAFGSITTQGLPFYGGNITYHIPVQTKGGSLCIRSSQYRGAAQLFRLDCGEEIPLIYPPYDSCVQNVTPGSHTIDILLYGNRRNSFGPVHLADSKDKWIGPEAWRTEGDRWCYEYKLCEMGLLSSPKIVEISK